MRLDLWFLDLPVFDHAHDVLFNKTAFMRHLENAAHGDEKVVDALGRACWAFA